MLTTRFTELIGCRVPIQPAAMGGVSTAALARAVAEAGGLGMVGAEGVAAPVLAARLDAMTRQVSGAFGVTFLIPFRDDRACVEIAATRARVVEFFYAGESVGAVRRRQPAAAIVEALCAEAERWLRRARSGDP